MPPSEEPVFIPDEGKVKVAEMVVLDDCDDMKLVGEKIVLNKKRFSSSTAFICGLESMRRF